MSTTILLSPLKTSNEAVNLSATTELNHRNSTVCERVINNQQWSFLHEHAHWDLIKSTWPVTATVVHSHRNQILHFESLLEIQMVAGTCERPSSSKRSKDLVIYRKWRLLRWTKLKRKFLKDVWHEHGWLLLFGARLVSWFPFKNRKFWRRMHCWRRAFKKNVLYLVFVYKPNLI